MKYNKIEMSGLNLENRFQKYGTKKQRFASFNLQLIDNNRPATLKLDIKIDTKKPKGKNGIIPYEIIEVKTTKSKNFFKRRSIMHNKDGLTRIFFKVFNLIFIIKKLIGSNADFLTLGISLAKLVSDLLNITLTTDQGCILYALFNLTGGKIGEEEEVIFETIKDYNPSINKLIFDRELKRLIDLECVERKNGKIFLIEEITVRDSFKSYFPFAKKVVPIKK